MSPTATASAATCPQCNAPMRPRRGPRGDFLGCTRYPECRGSRPLQLEMNRPAPATPPRQPAPASPPTEAPGPTGELISDLRKAAGHLGAAIDILRRRAPQLDAVMSSLDDDVSF